jgi:two-component system response regulator CssR
MSKNIYLVEDEKSLNVLLKKYLQKEGYNVTTFFDGSSAIERIEDQPHLWILDIMLPDIDGYQIIKLIKENNKDIPVLFMSARNEELDRVVGLELGSDDYISKPFLPRELVIRTNKIIERVYLNQSVKMIDEIIDIGDYRISKNQRTVFYFSNEIQLTKMEFDLLLFLVENKNKVIDREKILTRVWGEDYFGSSRVVDDTIRRLRKKVDKLIIETIYGFGYKLVFKL